MYPKVKRVRRGGQTYEYLELVEGRRDGATVRQRVVASLGRLDKLTASGRLAQLTAGLARLDAPPVGTRREVGSLLLVAHYLTRLGLVDIVDRAALAGWASSAAVAELLDVPGMLLNDDRLGRALEALAPLAETVRGELALAAATRSAVDLSRLHLDLTAVRFAGAFEDSTLVAKGWAADRSIARQVKTLQACTPDGVTVYLRPHQGAANELPCFTAALQRLAELAPPGVVVVADSGLGYLANLCTADTAGLRFVVPLRADTGWAARFTTEVGALTELDDLDYCSQREARRPAHDRTRWTGLLRPFPVTDDTTTHHLRVAYIWSSQEAAAVAGGRERALAKAEQELTRVRNGLGGRYYKTKKQVDVRVARIIGANIADLLTVTTGPARHGKPTLTWHRNHDAITAAARLDGLYALATNLPDPTNHPLTATDILTIYKDQWMVEQRHRDLKQTLKVRPVFLHNDDRIEALIAVIGIALLIFGLIEADLRHHLGDGVTLPGVLPEGRAAKPTARAVLAAFDGLYLTHTPTGPVLDPLTEIQRTILAHLAIPLPWPEQQSKQGNK